MKFKYLYLLSFLVLVVQTKATDGMWLPNLLKKLNEPEMQSLGMKITAEDIYSVNKGSIKDAIVHFGGFCTGEVVSNQGLVLTNHHCGYGQIQQHSSPENNYLEHGFWAASHKEELNNPGLTATFIRRIEDISEAALANVTAEMTSVERQSQIDKNLNEIRTNTVLKPHENIIIRPFYEGNEYYMFVTVVYKDVRLVGTPPSFIGKYGADTDNWIWPRHTGDFAIFRIYANADNEPADYNPDNVPYTPEHSLPISINGLKQDDFVMVFGFPGRTDQYLHSEHINSIKDAINPTRVEIRDLALAVIDDAMRKDPLVKIQYASKQSRISNAWKKWRGESLGLNRSNAVKNRQQYENEFNRRIAKNSNWSHYANLTRELQEHYQKLEPLQQVNEVYAETVIRNTEITRLASRIGNLLQVYEKSGEEAFQAGKTRELTGLPNYFKDYQIEIDRQVFASLMDYYTNNMPEEYISDEIKDWLITFSNDWGKISKYIFSHTNFGNESQLTALLKLPYEDFETEIKKDPVYVMVKSINDIISVKLTPEYTETIRKINELKRTYMKAQREVFAERRFAPDANGTIRVSYGKIDGYKPRDGIFFEPFTTLNGVMDKYVPGDYEFDLDEKFKTLANAKDFGRYGSNGNLVVNFIASLHSTGGNSGSPVINGEGHLVGLLFDGSWEGVMSDIYYSDELVRSIMVDIRYVLWVIDKYAGAQNLISEMNIIN